MKENIKEDLRKKSGIYKITNKLDGKIYIGSAIDLYRRFNQHYNQLINNKHVNIYLQRAFNKYGIESFTFEVVEFVDDAHNLVNREQNWIDMTRCFDGNIGYNLSPTAGSTFGLKHTEQQRINNSVSKQGLDKATNIINVEIASEIKKMLNSGATIKEISDNLQVKKEAVRGIRRGLAWVYVDPQLNFDINIDMKAKLNIEEIEKVRELLLDNVKVKDIAEMFNVNYRTISAIKNNINWKSEESLTFTKRNKRLPDEDVIIIKNLLAQGKDKIELCEQFNINMQTVNGIKAGRSYKHLA